MAQTPPAPPAGNFTALGPGTFADNDGQVIRWKDEQYVPLKRLRLAHQARRAKEHQLDDVRRALCDIGFMEDDDPYSHADLANVIRQNGQTPTESSGQERDDAQAALARVRAFAAQLEEFAEDALKEDDRKLYAALARDLRTRIGDTEPRPIPAEATEPALDGA